MGLSKKIKKSVKKATKSVGKTVKRIDKEVSHTWTKYRDEIYIGAAVAGVVALGVATGGFGLAGAGALGGAGAAAEAGSVGAMVYGSAAISSGDILAAAMVGKAGLDAYNSHEVAKANEKAAKEQQRALAQQEAELARQKELIADQQRRENQQLMGAVTGLTNTSYTSNPITNDKYGDLG